MLALRRSESCWSEASHERGPPYFLWWARHTSWRGKAAVYVPCFSSLSMPVNRTHRDWWQLQTVHLQLLYFRRLSKLTKLAAGVFYIRRSQQQLVDTQAALSIGEEGVFAINNEPVDGMKHAISSHQIWRTQIRILFGSEKLFIQKLRPKGDFQ